MTYYIFFKEKVTIWNPTNGLPLKHQKNTSSAGLICSDFSLQEEN